MVRCGNLTQINKYKFFLILIDHLILYCFFFNYISHLAGYADTLSVSITFLIWQGMLIYYFAVYVYPYSVLGYDEQWAEKLGWVISTTPITFCLILGAVHAICKEKGNFKQVIQEDDRVDYNDLLFINFKKKIYAMLVSFRLKGIPYVHIDFILGSFSCGAFPFVVHMETVKTNYSYIIIDQRRFRMTQVIGPEKV